MVVSTKQLVPKNLIHSFPDYPLVINFIHFIGQKTTAKTALLFYLIFPTSTYGTEVYKYSWNSSGHNALRDVISCAAAFLRNCFT